MLSAPNVGAWGGGGTVEGAAAVGQRDLGDGGALMPLGGASFGPSPSTRYPPYDADSSGGDIVSPEKQPKDEKFLSDINTAS